MAHSWKNDSKYLKLCTVNFMKANSQGFIEDKFLLVIDNLLDIAQSVMQSGVVQSGNRKTKSWI